jgi:hypothetical protein
LHTPIASKEDEADMEGISEQSQHEAVRARQRDCISARNSITATECNHESDPTERLPNIGNERAGWLVLAVKVLVMLVLVEILLLFGSLLYILLGAYLLMYYTH